MATTTITPGVIVRAHDWPGTRGERFLVLGIGEMPSGEAAHLLEFDGGTPFRYRCIPTENLAVDQKATRERDRRMAAQQEMAAR